MIEAIENGSFEQLGIKGFKNVGRSHLMDDILIIGSSATFKSTFALNLGGKYKREFKGKVYYFTEYYQSNKNTFFKALDDIPYVNEIQPIYIKNDFSFHENEEIFELLDKSSNNMLIIIDVNNLTAKDYEFIKDNKPRNSFLIVVINAPDKDLIPGFRFLERTNLGIKLSRERDFDSFFKISCIKNRHANNFDDIHLTFTGSGFEVYKTPTLVSSVKNKLKSVFNEKRKIR